MHFHRLNSHPCILCLTTLTSEVFHLLSCVILQVLHFSRSRNFPHTLNRKQGQTESTGFFFIISANPDNSEQVNVHIWLNKWMNNLPAGLCRCLPVCEDRSPRRFRSDVWQRWTFPRRRWNDRWISFQAQRPLGQRPGPRQGEEVHGKDASPSKGAEIVSCNQAAAAAVWDKGRLDHFQSASILVSSDHSAFFPVVFVSPK